MNMTINVKIDHQCPGTCKATLRIQMKDDDYEYNMVLIGDGFNEEKARFDLLEQYRQWIIAQTENKMKVVSEILGL